MRPKLCQVIKNALRRVYMLTTLEYGYLLFPPIGDGNCQIIVNSLLKMTKYWEIVDRGG